MNAQQILDFWFSPETEPYWFAKSDAFDAKIRTQFLAVWQQAAAANFTIGATTSQAASPKSLFLTNSRAICIAATRAPLRKTAWH